MRNQKQKNLKVILSMGQKELSGWLGTLPEQKIDRIEWLVEEIKYELDNILIEHFGINEAKDLLARFTLDK